MTKDILAWLAKIRKDFIPSPGRVLEVGAYNVNGSARRHFQQGSASYLGVDQQKGPGVDQVMSSHELRQHYPPCHFNTVICCEMLEHDSDPLRSIVELREMVAPGGYLIVTSPSNGFPLHRFPKDYWRLMPHVYEDVIFKNMVILDRHTTPDPVSTCNCYLGQNTGIKQTRDYCGSIPLLDQGSPVGSVNRETLGPMFSIIAVHYQGVVSHEVFCRGINSIMAQTFKDFELLVYHDGPMLDSRVTMPVPIRCTESRYNDWGHSLRDQGIREAKGQYIVHFNADNILYPNALAEIVREIERPHIIVERGQALDTNDIIIFPVKMMGLQKWRHLTLRWKGNPSFYLILTGNPPVLFNIDCMQLVMKRELWLREGGWYDRRKESDGLMYQKFAQQYGYRTVGPILGEHR